MAKAVFTAGLFAIMARLDTGVVQVKVNVRTDQERQRELAHLAPDLSVQIVDLPGGGVEVEDFIPSKKTSLLHILRREVAEETGGCSIEELPSAVSYFRGPYYVVINTEDPTKPTGDWAFWMPVRLVGDPKPTDEALDHVWLSRNDLERGLKYRPVGGLGLQGRTGQMMMDGLAFFEERARVLRGSLSDEKMYFSSVR